MNSHRVNYFGLLYLLLFMGCSSSATKDKSLPSAQELGSYRGYRVVRALIHLHSPISYDACDTGNTHCKEDLRAALCSNRIDFAFLTDHPDNMAKNSFSDLLLSASGDQAVTQSGNTVGTQITCSNSHTVQVFAGYEDRLMPIGMTKHLDPDSSVRSGLYTGETADLVSRLKSETDAIVFVPHTESRSVDLLSSLGVDGIEIYNLHANVNPTMRHDYLGFDYFSGLPDLAVYWVDPYGKQQPDLAFMSFLQVSPVYAQKWDQLISRGQHVTGIGGNDSHQNFFPGVASDGDRVDSHRRLIRWVTNHFLVKDTSLTEIKSAIRKARGWVVFEGLGTPTGLDFHADNEASTAEIGDTLTLVTGRTKVHVELPTLHANSPRSKQNPTVIIRLKKVASSAEETTVATSTNSSLDYSVTDPGAYRAEIAIIPLHLKEFMGYKDKRATQEIPWMITNHIYIQ